MLIFSSFLAFPPHHLTEFNLILTIPSASIKNCVSAHPRIIAKIYILGGCCCLLVDHILSPPQQVLLFSSSGQESQAFQRVKSYTEVWRKWTGLVLWRRYLQCIFYRQHTHVYVENELDHFFAWCTWDWHGSELDGMHHFYCSRISYGTWVAT